MHPSVISRTDKLSLSQFFLSVAILNCLWQVEIPLKIARYRLSK